MFSSLVLWRTVFDLDIRNVRRSHNINVKCLSFGKLVQWQNNRLLTGMSHVRFMYFPFYLIIVKSQKVVIGLYADISLIGKAEVC